MTTTLIPTSVCTVIMCEINYSISITGWLWLPLVRSLIFQTQGSAHIGREWSVQPPRTSPPPLEADWPPLVERIVLNHGCNVCLVSWWLHNCSSSAFRNYSLDFSRPLLSWTVYPKHTCCWSSCLRKVIWLYIHIRIRIPLLTCTRTVSFVNWHIL